MAKYRATGAYIEHIVPVRTCARCQQPESASVVFGKDHPSGPRVYCNACGAERSRLWRQAHPQKAKESVEKWRHKERSAEDAARMKNAKNESDKRYRSSHIEKIKEYDNLRHRSEHRQVWLKEYNKDTGVRERKAAYMRAYAVTARRKVYRRRYRETHHTDIILRYRTYRAENRHKFIAYQNKRRVPGEMDAEHVRLLRETGKCWYCGQYHVVTIDHVLPLSRGGTHGIDNLAPACASCNSSKGPKLLSEWSAEASLRYREHKTAFQREHT